MNWYQYFRQSASFGQSNAGCRHGWVALNLPRVMKRRNFKRLRPDRRAEHHHHVYVVLLDPAVGRLRKVRAANPTGTNEFGA